MLLRLHLKSKSTGEYMSSKRDLLRRKTNLFNCFYCKVVLRKQAAGILSAK